MQITAEQLFKYCQGWIGAAIFQRPKEEGQTKANISFFLSFFFKQKASLSPILLCFAINESFAVCFNTRLDSHVVLKCVLSEWEHTIKELFDMAKGNRRGGQPGFCKTHAKQASSLQTLWLGYRQTVLPSRPHSFTFPIHWA